MYQLYSFTEKTLFNNYTHTYYYIIDTTTNKRTLYSESLIETLKNNCTEYINSATLKNIHKKLQLIIYSKNKITIDYILKYKPELLI